MDSLSERYKKANMVLKLKRQSMLTITDTEMRERNVGHGLLLKEKGFYPIGHKDGVIVMSYYDWEGRCTIYEKLAPVAVFHQSKIEEKKVELQEGERLIYFD